MGILIQSRAPSRHRAAASELRPRSSMQRQAEIAEMRPSVLGHVKSATLSGRAGTYSFPMRSSRTKGWVASLGGFARSRGNPLRGR